MVWYRRDLIEMSTNGQTNGKLTLEPFSFGVGDRFGRQAEAQLRACMMAAEHGVDVIPVWNKSNREHVIIGSGPSESRHAVEAAIGNLGWKRAYHVDADHIRLDTVDRFIPHSDFYTIDVADTIGKTADAATIQDFARRHPELAGNIEIPGIAQPFRTTRSDVERIAGKYLLAVEEAKQIYMHIAAAKGEGHFITEISMDETDSPQSPIELLIILAAVADMGIPIQTIAPKFTGRFNKGVDYAGNVAKFETEFNDDLAVVRFAVSRYHLPQNLKLSVHSGSDKFSIYGSMRRALNRFNAGLHIKTAGTTWLEEIIGLAEAGGEGLILAREIYAGAFDHLDELCAPYATVIEIDATKLPSKETVNGWNSEQFVAALRHDPKNSSYNPHLRQLLHVGYKIAAKMGDRYLDALKQNEKFVSKNVTENLYQRHLRPLFIANGAANTPPLSS
jgi:tagaturonate epimerase